MRLLSACNPDLANSDQFPIASMRGATVGAMTRVCELDADTISRGAITVTVGKVVMVRE